jgi:hypothetical protein
VSVDLALATLLDDEPNPFLTEAGFERVRERGGIFRFRCPTCRKTFQNDSPLEPICTGPSESRDDHEPTVMQAVVE